VGESDAMVYLMLLSAPLIQLVPPRPKEVGLSPSLSHTYSSRRSLPHGGIQISQPESQCFGEVTPDLSRGSSRRGTCHPKSWRRGNCYGPSTGQAPPHGVELKPKLAQFGGQPYPGMASIPYTSMPASPHIPRTPVGIPQHL
jgi:hypothetical protein